MTPEGELHPIIMLLLVCAIGALTWALLIHWAFGG